MGIADVSSKKILKWVSKTDYHGFNVFDIEKGLKLNSYQKAEVIFGFLKQNGFIQHIGGLSPLYKKTTKVITELKNFKQWYEKPIGMIIVAVISGILVIIISNLLGFDAINEITVRLFLITVPQ